MSAISHTIVRYKNRKLYDTSVHDYVGRDALLGWISKGEVVKIHDHVTQTDITAEILCAVLQNLCKDGYHPPVDVLHYIVREQHARRATSKVVEHADA